MAVLHTTINGEAITAEVDPSISLAQFLRDNLYLTGTKIGCGKGECGACTIIMDGKSTIEGVAKNGKLHPLQEEFINQGAVQCGFCTPGMIMSAKALLDENPEPKKEEIREALGGNICRCTGYVNIERAVEAAAQRIQKGE